MGNSPGRPIVFTDEVHLEHFKLLRVVGKGAFGKVRIVERKDTGLTFALKYVRKDEIVRHENVRNIVRERKMLEHLNHPFLCNLRYSFQDYEFVYLVVDLMNGGDLRFHIERKTFTEAAVRFWIAELGCALRYIHGQGIVHRDVKPDNVLLDSEGHLHLADFNVAADFTDGRKALTSKSGTLAYVAPEAMAGIPYKSEVDWWALGVLFYECIYGKRPFQRRKGAELEELVVEAKPKYPLTDPSVDPLCVDALKNLIVKKVSKRLGANGFENFTQHPFFAPIDFEALERKEITPIFRPSSEKMNFDATYDLEELLLEESPLEARARHQKPRAALKNDATAQEKKTEELHRMIETYFEPFDYQKASFEKLPGAQANSTLPVDSGIIGQAITTSDSSEGYHTPGSERPARSIRSQRSDNLSDTGEPPFALDTGMAAIRSQTGSSSPVGQTDSPPLLPPSNITGLRSTHTAPEIASPLGKTRNQGVPRPITTRPGPAPRSLSMKLTPQKAASAIDENERASVGIAREGGLHWKDLEPRMAVRSEDEPGQGRKKSKGVIGFLSRRKTSQKSLNKTSEDGIIGKAGIRTILAEDGG